MQADDVFFPFWSRRGTQRFVPRVLCGAQPDPNVFEERQLTLKGSTRGASVSFLSSGRFCCLLSLNCISRNHAGRPIGFLTLRPLLVSGEERAAYYKYVLGVPFSDTRTMPDLAPSSLPQSSH